jgi:flagellar biosynthesis protein FlhF
LRQALQSEITNRLSTDATLGLPTSDSRVVALVGPPGAGKTTNLVKLAVRYGLTARKPIQLLSVDHVRIGAADQLRTYAGILGVGFEAVETVGALAQAIEAHRGKDLVLIDTPGYSLKDIDDSQDLASFLSNHPDIDTHLVLMASLKSADLRRMADGFARFRPRKLLFSQVDQTERFGTAWSESVRSGRPISFLSTGQSIPEDLEEATAKGIVERLISFTMPGTFPTATSKTVERAAGRKAAGTGAAA